MKISLLLCLSILASLAQNLENELKALERFDKKLTQQNITLLSNPFLLPSAPSDTSLQLEAIINQKALVNGQWLSLNQIIQDHKLINIESQSITLQKGSNFITLSLKPLQKDLP